MTNFKQPEDIAEEALGIIVEWETSQYVAKFSVPHTETLKGYGRSENVAVKQLLLRGYAAPNDVRRRLFSALDKALSRVSETKAPLHWSYSFDEEKCYITATDDEGRSDTTFVRIERKDKNECEKE